MSVPVSPDPPDDAVSEPPSEEEVRELVLKARSGDRSAAYEVLGRQLPVETWVQVLHQLARNAAPVDLEVVAHRTLRRPPAVAAAVLELAEAARTPIAAFLARVVAESRPEESLRSAAASLNGELVSALDVVELLAGDDATGALYALLARPLSDQARLVSQLAEDARASTKLFDAARAEYERLQEVARDTRWRSGSYRHALRHALADLALVAGVGGRLEEQAFRLLQQRTDQPEANEELLGLVSADLRLRYLDWSLDRSSAESSPARALFALDELERYPDGVDRKTIQRLVVSKDPEVAAAAAAYLVRSDPADGSNDREIAELLATADPTKSARLIGAIARSAPERLRLDLWPQVTDAIVVAEATGSAAIAERLTRTVEESPDPDVRLRALRVVLEIVQTVDGREEVGRAVAVAVLAQTQAGAAEIALLVSVGLLREAAWRGLDGAPSAVQMRWLDLLLEADSANVVWTRLRDLHDRTKHDQRHELEEFVLDAVAAGRLDAEDPGDADPSPFLDALRVEAEQRARAAIEEMERLRSLIALGDRAAEVELAELVQPLVARAVERSTGNERLVNDFREVELALTVADVAPEVQDSEVDEAELDAIAAALTTTGVDLLADKHHVTAALDENVKPMQVVRALAIIDQRIGRAANLRQQRTATTALAATADEAARTGTAEEILRDLFERGPLFQAAIALSPQARRAVLEAALKTGFHLPDAWREHDVLGKWLIDATSDAPANVPAPVTAADALILLQRIEHERRDAEERLRAGRTAARHAFVASAAPALEHLEQTTDTYVQLWLGLGRLGIRQVAALGERIHASELDPERHEVLEGSESQSYVVRSAGLEVEGEVVRRARVEEIN